MRLRSGHGAAGVGSLLLLLLFLSKGAVLSGLYDDDVDDEESFTLSAVGNEVRSFDGTDNNQEQRLWGSVGQTQIRHVAASDYADGISTPSDEDRPTPREILSEVFLAAPSSSSSTSALYVGWGLLVGFDMVLNMDNASEPYPIECNSPPITDVWCPAGSLSEDIPFHRSDAALNADDGGARSPVNYATAYVDLDWLYGRSEDAANEIRLRDGTGRLNLTDENLPHLLPNGTWLVADQRPATFPVTFALQATLMREHNRCCDEDAIDWGATTEEDLFQFCRQWNIAVFQHITENDFAIKMLGGNVKQLGAETFSYDDDPDDTDTETASLQHVHRRRRLPLSHHEPEERRLPRQEGAADEGGDDGRGRENRQTTRATRHAADTAGGLIESAQAVAAGAAAASGGNSGTGSGGRLPFRSTVGVQDETQRVSSRRRGRRRRRLSAEEYDEAVDAGVDVFFSTVALPAFYSALPPTVSLLDETFDVMDEDGIELADAAADLGGLVTRAGGIEPILRGAAYSRTRAVDASFASEIAVSSPLFNLPVETIQRSRDHGIPPYNDVRAAYGLDPRTSFEEITPDVTVQELLSATYGGDVGLLDAYTGAVVEQEQDGSNFVVGPLLREAYLDQLYRAIVGDYHHHEHSVQNENATLSTLTGLIQRTAVNATMPDDAFTAPELAVPLSTVTNVAFLEDGYRMEWNLTDKNSDSPNSVQFKLSARGIGTLGMIAIGLGGETMSTTTDFVICLVSSDTEAECQDRRGPGERAEPPKDWEEEVYSPVVVEVIGEWTSVSFTRPYQGNNDEDFDLSGDINNNEKTNVIYSWRSGAGLEQHPNTQRGASKVDFNTGEVEDACDDSRQFYALHGALILLAWMVVAPYGLYQARYCKGKTSFIGNTWWEMHEECMIVCAEALIPLSITAVVTTGGSHVSEHAKWGFYMVGAIVLQLLTGWMRVRGLEAKGSNFSLFHRVNKYVHIYLGWFAYGAGLIQCYRGIELVSGADKLMFSAVDIDFTFANFGIVRRYVFPVWLGIIPPIFLYLEVRKQYRRFFAKGSANLCGLVEVVNQEFSDEAIKEVIDDRLIPRTDLPIYTTEEFNEKILNGRSWIIVDGAVLDVSTFAKRHPGGARLILNAMGTDVTSEIVGEEASIGNSNMAFFPHRHTDTALEIARSLVIGYIEEEDDIDPDECTGVSHSDYSNDVASGGDIGSSTAVGNETSEDSSGAFSYRNGYAAARRRSLARGQTGSVSFGGFGGGRLASFCSDDDNSSDLNLRANAGRPVSLDARTGAEARRKLFTVRRRRTSVSDSSGGEGSGTDKTRGNRDRPTSLRPAIGKSLQLSDAAAAILNAISPVPDAPPPEAAPMGEGSAVVKASDHQRSIPRCNTAPADGTGSMPRTDSTLGVSTEGGGDRGGVGMTVADDRKAPPKRSSSLVQQQQQQQQQPSTRRRSVTEMARGAMMRVMSMDGSMTSGNDTETEGEGRQMKVTKRVWEKKNPLSFFHVCPLLLHEKMNKVNDRPVYRFVFSCPGKATALVNAVTGVCHFNMRVAQEDGKMIQRTYNAFAVRVLPEEKEGVPRKVVPISDSTEGEACIEMRIRIYSDGAMSTLLMQLIKNADNPAVQLQGPFLRDSLIPPPAHRNVVMIAAGTGVNPMVQIIRNYLNLDPALRNDGTLGGHTRLVLIWQNTHEADLYGVDELIKLQAQSRGLLEVVSLVSGDLTRRKKTGAAFRRAKAKVVAMGMAGKELLEGSEGSCDDDDNDGLEAGAVSRASSSKRGKNSKRTTSSSRKRQTSKVIKLSDNEDNRDNDKTGSDGHEEKTDEAGTGGGIFDDLPTRLPVLHANRLSRVVEEMSQLSQSSRSNSKRGSLHDGSRDNSRKSLMIEGGGETTVDQPDRLSLIPPAPAAGGPAVISHSTGASDAASAGTGHRGRRDQLADMSFSALMMSAAANAKDEEIRGGNRSKGRGEKSRMAQASSVAPAASSSAAATRGGAETSTDSAITPKMTTATGKRRADSRAGGADYTGTSDEGSAAAADARQRPTTVQTAHSTSYTIAVKEAKSTRRASGGGGQGDSSRGRAAASSASKKEHSRGKRSSKKSHGNETMDADWRDPLSEPGTGLRRGKVSKEMLKRAIGEPARKTIAATRVSCVGAANLDAASAIAGKCKDALRHLCGTPTSGGQLQIVVSGPAGFVFHVEGLLAEVRVPPQVVVLLD